MQGQVLAQSQSVVYSWNKRHINAAEFSHAAQMYLLAKHKQVFQCVFCLGGFMEERHDGFG